MSSIEYGQLIKKGSFLAIRSPEDSYYLCQVNKSFHLIRGCFAITWLEKIKNSTGEYILGKKDKVETESIICEIYLNTISRFKYKLSIEGKKFIEQELASALQESQDSTNLVHIDRNSGFTENLPIETRNSYREDFEIKSDNLENDKNADCIELADNINVNDENTTIDNCNLEQEKNTDPLKVNDDTTADNLHSLGTTELTDDIHVNDENMTIDDSNLEQAKNTNPVKVNDDTTTDNVIEKFSCLNSDETTHDSLDKNSKELFVEETRSTIPKYSSIIEPTDSDTFEEPYQDSGSEYIPSEDEKTGHHFNFNLKITQSKIKKKLPSKNNYDNAVIPTTSTSTKECDKIIEQLVNQKKTKLLKKRKKTTASQSQYNNVNISVARSNLGKRVYDKRHSCYFCQTKVLKIARHLELKHSNEIAIAQILAKTKKSAERKNQFLQIVRAGDFYHNTEVIAAREGELILARRPSSNQQFSYSDYGPCPHCLGFMLKKHLWLHCKHCIANTSKGATANPSKFLRMESNALMNSIIMTEIDPTFRTIIVDTLKNDEISGAIQNDFLILHFGKMLFEKYGVTQKELIRQNMRQLARMKLKLMEENIDFRGGSLKDFLLPEHFDKIVNATRIISGANLSTREYGIPSLAMKLGYSLRKCIGVLRGHALRKGDLGYEKKLKSFLDILDLEWSIKISHHAIATMHQRKMNTATLLPVTSDLLKLNTYILAQINILTMGLSRSKADKDLWLKLAQVTLCRIILFNKRRGGEVSRMLISQYKTETNWAQETTEELQNSLSELEKKMASDMKLVQIRGKRGRTVPVLLDKTMCAAMDLLIQLREFVEISSENPYVFARVYHDSKEYLRGPDCMRNVCAKAELSSPHSITSTKLRKYVATVSQVLDLKEYEADWLARHLGHDIRVHRDYYRMHESAVELTKISRLLMTVDEGKISKFYGKSLDQINLNELPDLNDGVSEPEASDLEEENEQSNTRGHESDFEEVKIVRNVKRCRNKSPQTEMEGKSLIPRKRKFTRKRPWSSHEVKVVTGFFKVDIKKEIVPGKAKCEELKQQHPEVLNSRTWKDIKYYVKNFIDRCKKQRH